MDEKPNSQQDTGDAPARNVEARQRRALARLGLASVSAYAAPTLLALRSAVRSTDAPDRVIYAA